MINILHGKHYYITYCPQSSLDDKGITIWEFLKSQEALQNEDFKEFVDVTEDNKILCVIVSKAKCGEFRGEKLKAWERVKRYAYKLKNDI